MPCPWTTGKESMQNFSDGPPMSCLVPGRSARALTAWSAPIWKLFTAVPVPVPIRIRLREPPMPPSIQGFQFNFVWLGISRECWKPCNRALVGTVVFKEYENVAAGSYASRSADRCVSSVVKKLNRSSQSMYFWDELEATDRKRKLLTMEPSTPVTNETPISHGNFVAVGRLTKVEGDVDGCGTSKEI
jgi:hypothetical protein